MGGISAGQSGNSSASGHIGHICGFPSLLLSIWVKVVSCL